MKYIILFESFSLNSAEFENIKINLKNYINKFYISKTSFGKFFINDNSGKLIIEVASKSKYGYTKLEYFIDYFKAEDGKFPLTEDTIQILLELLNKKFPKIKIKGIIYEDNF
jgi:hypothetical protein